MFAARMEQGLVKLGEEVVFLPIHTVTNPCTGKVLTVETLVVPVKCLRTWLLRMPDCEFSRGRTRASTASAELHVDIVCVVIVCVELDKVSKVHSRPTLRMRMLHVWSRAS